MPKTIPWRRSTPPFPPPSRGQALGRHHHVQGYHFVRPYNLSDDQVEYQMRDRLSFVRFLGLTLQDKVPDAKTVWLYCERLSRAGLIDALFEDFDGYPRSSRGQVLKSQGYRAMGGQIIDASMVAVPIQRNSRDENEQIILRPSINSGSLRSGEPLDAWADEPAKRRQKSLPPA